jgi:DNA polymerase zeta
VQNVLLSGADIRYALTNVAATLNARQFGLKLLANVTYGYTAASFSGRMPCAELADAIVQVSFMAVEPAIMMVAVVMILVKNCVFAVADALHLERA